MQSSWWWPVIHRCYRCYNITTATGDCSPHVGQLPFHPSIRKQCCMTIAYYSIKIFCYFTSTFFIKLTVPLFMNIVYTLSGFVMWIVLVVHTQGLRFTLPYTASKNPCHPTFVHYCGVCWPIFNFFTAGFSNEFVIKALSCFYHNLHMLLHYLGNVNVQTVSFSGSKLLQKPREKCSRNTQTMMSHLFGLLMRKYLRYSRT